jgi:hypothetical protein
LALHLTQVGALHVGQRLLFGARQLVGQLGVGAQAVQHGGHL